MEQEGIIVSVICCTYNQERYIKRCLDGIIMQRTSFNYEVLVHDDASVDSTPEIIREYERKYPDVIKPIYQRENQFSKRKGIIKTFQIPRAKGKYIAFCEGDDYWIDPYKLQKQVDFLEKNPGCVLVHTNFDFFYQNESLLVEAYDADNNIKQIRESGENIIYKILDGNAYRIQTVTAMLRASVYVDVLSTRIDNRFLMSDTQTWCYMINLGDIHYMEDVTSVYRINDGSACRSLDVVKKIRFDLSCEEMRCFVSSDLKLDKNAIEMFQRRYKKQLILYLAFDNDYQPFIKIDFRNWLEKFIYALLSTRIMRAIIRQVYLLKYKHKVC